MVKLGSKGFYSVEQTYLNKFKYADYLEAVRRSKKKYVRKEGISIMEGKRNLFDKSIKFPLNEINT